MPDALRQFEAAALFVERAHAHQPSFALTTANAPAVAHICSRLDGIPLALEMAAARVNVFTVEELATRLEGAFDARFQLLTNGVRTAPFRQQTLWATLEWSYGLLTASEHNNLLDREHAFALAYLGLATAKQGDLPLARTQLQKRLSISQQHNDWAGMAYALHGYRPVNRITPKRFSFAERVWRSGAR